MIAPQNIYAEVTSNVFTQTVVGIRPLWNDVTLLWRQKNNQSLAGLGPN